MFFLLQFTKDDLCQICAVTSREARAYALETSLRKLGVEKLSKDDVQKMQWEVLEAKIGNWIHFMRIAVRTFAEIYKVYAFIFLSFDSAKTGQTAVCWRKKNL